MDLNVVHFSDDYFPNIGGVAAAVHGISKGLAEQGVQVHVMTRAGNVRSASHEVENDVPVLRLPPNYTWGRYQAYCRRELEKVVGNDVVRSGKLIVHSHWAHPWWVNYPVRKVFTNHTSLFLQDCATGATEKWQKRFAQFDHIITASDLLRSKTIPLGMPPERVTYINNGVDARRFRPSPEKRAALRRRLGIADDAVVVLCAKRCVPVAGIIDFAHALRYIEAQVAPHNKQVAVVFAGNRTPARDDYEKETLEAFGSCELGRNAHILGEVPNEQMPDLFAAADISTLPSLKEATSISGLESMASGVPIVGTRIGGIPDLIQDGVDGLIVDHGNPPQLADAIARLVLDDGLRLRLAQQARAKVEDRFSWDSVARRTIAIYESILAGPKLSGPKSSRRPAPEEAVTR